MDIEAPDTTPTGCHGPCPAGSICNGGACGSTVCGNGAFDGLLFDEAATLGSTLLMSQLPLRIRVRSGTGDYHHTKHSAQHSPLSMHTPSAKKKSFGTSMLHPAWQGSPGATK